jgi:hypothetical protein
MAFPRSGCPSSEQCDLRTLLSGPSSVGEDTNASTEHIASYWRAVGNENIISSSSVIKSQMMKVVITLIVVALLVMLLTSAIWKNRRR